MMTRPVRVTVARIWHLAMRRIRFSAEERDSGSTSSSIRTDSECGYSKRCCRRRTEAQRIQRHTGVRVSRVSDSMNATDDIEGLSKSEMTIMSLYCVVLVVGVLANASLALSVCGQQSSRNKNPLLLSLCLADLLVCCLSAPITVCFTVFASKPWPFTTPWCKLAFFLQALPVAVSMLSLMLVSIDRYVTVKYPRPIGKYRHRRNIVTAATLSTWLISVLVTCPLLLVHRVPVRSGGRCVEIWISADLRSCYVLCRLVLFHVVPCIAVFACHVGVHAKLTALSLTARAAHGELPLPVPLLRRPTHVIIVAGIANTAADGKVMTYQPNGEDSTDAGRLVNKMRNGNTDSRRTATGSGRKRKKPGNRMRRATKSEDEIREENRKLRPQQHIPSARPVGSTLRSRRRLANALVSAAAVFVSCWLPHVVCTVCVELYTFPGVQLKQMMQYSLLLGHAHSAINPVVYWALNHQSLQSSCLRVSLLGHLRLPTVYRNASSTNEAALGPFHPRFTRPNTPAVRRQSSCYLY